MQKRLSVGGLLDAVEHPVYEEPLQVEDRILQICALLRLCRLGLLRKIHAGDYDGLAVRGA